MCFSHGNRKMTPAGLVAVMKSFTLLMMNEYLGTKILPLQNIKYTSFRQNNFETNSSVCKAPGFYRKTQLNSWDLGNLSIRFQVQISGITTVLGISDSQGLPYTANVVNKKSGAYIQNALNRATMGLSLKAKRFYRIGPWRLGSSYSNFWPVAMCQREFRIATFKRRTRDTLCSLL